MKSTTPKTSKPF